MISGSVLIPLLFLLGGSYISETSRAAHQMGHKEQYRQTTNALCPVSLKEVEIGIITKMCTFPLIFDYFR